MNWRPTVIVAEVLQNVRCRAVIWIVVGATSAAIIAALAGAELDAGSQAIELRQQLDRAGANVAVVESPSQTATGSASLDTGRCIALNNEVGIERAGSEHTLEPIDLVSAPGSPILRVETSGPTIAVWDPTLAADPAASSGTWATASLEDRLGVGVGTPVVIGANQLALTVTGVFEPTRAPQMGARLIYPGPPTARSDRCWIEVTSPLTQDKLIALASWFAADAPVVVRPLLDAHQLQFDPIVAHSSRTTKHAWFAIGLVTGSLWTLVTRSRRGEIALLMTVGASRLCAVGQIIAETLLISALAWGAGTGAGVIWWCAAHPQPVRSSDVLALGITSTALATSLAMSITAAGTVALSFGSRLQALKNRD
jgi:hypothetical protein